VKIRFGDPINVSEIVPESVDKEICYSTVTRLLKERIQQMLDELRSEHEKTDKKVSSLKTTKAQNI
jgi:hypothetical protein